jgi:glucose/arabinose dehydrogenase
MAHPSPSRSRSARRHTFLAGLGPATLCAGLVLSAASAAGAAPRCDADDAGLRLPEGFCALEFARGVGAVRNLVVAGNGDVFAARQGRGDGGVLALRDGDGDGRADEHQSFGSADGHGIALTDSHLYYAAHDRIVRWRLEPGRLVPAGEPETLVSGFPEQNEHRVKAIALGPDDALYVEVGAPSNSCQTQNRSAGSPGLDPCPQLERQAGIWRYSSREPGQQHTPERRFATGLRHALALAVHPESGELWAVVNGRDGLGSLWGFDDERNAALPAEEMVRVTRGSDFGWPYCYHDGQRERKLLAPEYGGDGEKRGRCADKQPPALAFPAHWAPMALLFHSGRGLPERYRGGAFVAFRGSWNRAPLPQEGYRVAFVEFAGGAPARFETFAIGAADPTAFRMTGVAEGPDGSLYLAADANERIWRVIPPARADAGVDSRRVTGGSPRIRLETARTTGGEQIDASTR